MFGDLGGVWIFCGLVVECGECLVGMIFGDVVEVIGDGFVDVE